MSKKIIIIAGVILAVSAMFLIRADEIEKTAGIEPSIFESHVRFLSHDLLEGRGIGTRGSALAQLYIETIFRLSGLKPVTDGSYRQVFKMLRFSPDQSAEMFIHSGDSMIPLKFGEDFICTNFGLKENSWSGKPVFIGYGISSSVDGWDFYKDTDVKGKLLIGFTNEPGRDNPSIFKGRELTWFGRWVYKYEEAARRGAAGLIIIHTDADAGYGWDVVRNSWSGDTFRLADDKYILPLQMWITEPSAKELLKNSGYNLNDLRKKSEDKNFKPVELPIQITVKSKLTTGATDGVNVVGIKPGSDPKLKDKAIILTAHYDHLGIGREIEGDSIYNGAVDNGTALSVLLSLADACGRGRIDNKMTLVFAAVDAEEEGMLGSIYYTMNPVVPLKDTIANINFEMNNAWGETRDVVAIGADKSDLMKMVGNAVSRMKMTITADNSPEQGFFYRSDQLSFARAGIPALWIDGGYSYIGKPDDYGAKIRAKYLANNYHKPSDQITADFNYTGLRQIAELTVLLIKEIETAGNINWDKKADFKR
jgi:Zn-dependent M28 family amino/carboxypeptidase